MIFYIFQGYCGEDYKGPPCIYEFESYMDEDMYLEIQDFKIGYDGVTVTQLPLCHDSQEQP